MAESRETPQYDLFIHFLVQKNGKNAKNSKILDILRSKWVKMAKKMQNPIYEWKPSLVAQLDQKTVVGQTGFSNCVETGFFNFRLETYDFRHFW